MNKKSKKAPINNKNKKNPEEAVKQEPDMGVDQNLNIQAL